MVGIDDGAPLGEDDGDAVGEVVAVSGSGDSVCAAVGTRESDGDTDVGIADVESIHPSGEHVPHSAQT